jgi:hypothetical protein
LIVFSVVYPSNHPRPAQRKWANLATSSNPENGGIKPHASTAGPENATIIANPALESSANPSLHEN